MQYTLVHRLPIAVGNSIRVIKPFLVRIDRLKEGGFIATGPSTAYGYGESLHTALDDYLVSLAELFVMLTDDERSIASHFSLELNEMRAFLKILG